MNFIIAYIISVLLSIVIDIAALFIRIIQIGLHGTISSREAGLIYLAAILSVVPGLNIVTTGCYLYKVLKG